MVFSNREMNCKIHKPIILESTIEEFIAKTININRLPLRHVLVYPHFAGLKDDALIASCQQIAFDIEKSLEPNGFSAQRYSVDQWINPELLGQSIDYVDGWSGSISVATKQVITAQRKCVKLVIPNKFIGPVFRQQGLFSAMLIPAEQISVDGYSRSSKAVWGDLLTGLAPNPYMRHAVHVFDITDEKHGRWIFAHLSWIEKDEQEMKDWLDQNSKHGDSNAF